MHCHFVTVNIRIFWEIRDEIKTGGSRSGSVVHTNVYDNEFQNTKYKDLHIRESRHKIFDYTQRLRTALGRSV